MTIQDKALKQLAYNLLYNRKWSEGEKAKRKFLSDNNFVKPELSEELAGLQEQYNNGEFEAVAEALS